MTYNFKLSDYPNDSFRMNISFWTGKSELYMNRTAIEQLKEKGKPFLIPQPKGDGFVKAFPKPSFPDFVPHLEINGEKKFIAPKLSLIQYAIGAIPICLLFLGGFLGGIVGVPAALINFHIFRNKETETTKYLKVSGVIVVAYVLYYIITLLFFKLIR